MPFRRKFAKRTFKKRSFKKKFAPKRKFKRTRTFKKRAASVMSGTGAHTVEIVDFGPLNLNDGDPYEMAFQISQFARANTIQAQFRFYRATRVEWIYEPAYDQYNANVVLSVTGTVSADSMPYIYNKMDRTGSAPFQSVSDLQDAGVKPRKWDRKFAITYMPNYLGQWQGFGPSGVADQVAPGLQTNPEGFGPGYVPTTNIAEKPKFGWLPTVQKAQNPTTGAITETFDDTIHWGHQTLIVQQNTVTGGAPRTYGNLLCKVHWEFKDPYIDQSLSIAGPVTAAKQLVGGAIAAAQLVKPTTTAISAATQTAVSAAFSAAVKATT